MQESTIIQEYNYYALRICASKNTTKATLASSAFPAMLLLSDTLKVHVMESMKSSAASAVPMIP